MRHSSVPKNSGLNYYNSFGGGNRDFITKNTYANMPHTSSYAVDGHGRDQYIRTNNGGLCSAY
jgi:hypothetical protein